MYKAVFETVYEGISTYDLGGSATTSAYTDEVIWRVERKLDVWDSLG